MANTKPSSGLQDALQRFAERAPKRELEVTKLPAEEPKPSGKAVTAYDESNWPRHFYVDSNQFPWIDQVKPGDTVYLLMQAKVDDITRHESTDDREPAVRADLIITEVAKA